MAWTTFTISVQHRQYLLFKEHGTLLNEFFPVMSHLTIKVTTKLANYPLKQYKMWLGVPSMQH